MDPKELKLYYQNLPRLKEKNKKHGTCAISQASMFVICD